MHLRSGKSKTLSVPCHTCKTKTKMVSKDDLTVMNDNLIKALQESFSQMRTTFVEAQTQHNSELATIQKNFDKNDTTTKGPPGLGRAPMFNGAGDDASEFLAQFRLYADFFNWSERQRLNAFPLSLTGSARTWYFALNVTIENFDQLSTLFTRNFISQTDDWVLRQELGKRKQLPSESLSDYNADIRKRCIRLKIPTSEQLHYFINGLSPSLRDWVVLNQPQTIDEALSVAKIKSSVSHNPVSALTNQDFEHLQKGFVRELKCHCQRKPGRD